MNPVVLPITFNTLPAGVNPAVDFDQNFNALKNAANSVAQYTPYVLDSGTPNVYQVTLSGGLTTPSYTDGLTFWLKPLNANTGGSTLQVNALGAIPIVNLDGTALSANQIISTLPVQLQYFNGKFIIRQSSTFSAGTFAVGITGLTTAPTTTAGFILSNDVVTLRFSPLFGTSNTTGCTLTGLPGILIPQFASQYVAWPAFTFSNNGVTVNTVTLLIGTDGTLTFINNGSPSGFANIGTKGVLQSNSNTVTVSYSLL